MNDLSKRVLITGISGFVGPLLAKKLLSLGYEVYGFYKRRADGYVPIRLRLLGLHNSIKLIEGDLSIMSSVIASLRESEPDVVFHLGAQSFVPRSFKDPIETYHVNTMGTIYLLEGIRLLDLDSKFIFAGSSEEYGLQFIDKRHYQAMKEKYGIIYPEPEKLPELPIDENNPLRPLSPYATSKVHGDFSTRNYYYSYGIKGIVSRAFNHEGPGRGPEFVTSAIVIQVLELIYGKRDYLRIGNVNAFRDWSHVNDVIDAYILLSEKGNPGDVYVVGSRRTNSVLSFILLTLKEFGYITEKLETLDGSITVKDPIEECGEKFFGLNFFKTKVDCMLLQGELEFELKHKGIKLYTSKGTVTVKFDPSKFRPSDVPILLSNPEKIMSLGWRINHSLSDIIKDQVAYYSDMELRKSIKPK